MTLVTVEEAQKNLPALIAASQRGEEVVITQEGSPVATIRAPEQKTGRDSLFGVFKGKIHIPDNFDEPLDEFAEYM